MFFGGYCRRLISGRGAERWAASPPEFDIFLIFPSFLSPSAIREATRVPSLLYLIKYRFTCGDSDPSEIIKMFQNIMTRIIVYFLENVKLITTLTSQ